MTLLTKLIACLALAAAAFGYTASAATAAPAAQRAEHVVVADRQAFGVSDQLVESLRDAATAYEKAGGHAIAEGSGIGTFAQGGFDRDHWWFKITKAEVVSIGAGVVCRGVFGSVGWFVCPPITAAINQAMSQWPNAGGFWGELYTNGQVRFGTW